MDAEWKRKWVEALRSGEYVQGKDFLRVDDKFCCLGVLCDLVGKERHEAWDYETHPYGRKGIFGGNDTFLPDHIVDLCGLSDDSPSVPNGERRDTLATFNDAGTNFTEIADLIEKHL